MYNKQLETFIQIAECGSFSKAAAQMYISASAVIQQINSLEDHLQVALFERSRSGVKLTPEGEYLLREGKAYIEKGKEIQRELLEIGQKNKMICIGTSLMQKVRLLYELWVLFSIENPDFDIQMINTQGSSPEKSRVDLIEGVLTESKWQQDWKFLKICDMPIGCGVPRGNSLSRKEKLSYADIEGQTMVTLNQKISQDLLILQKDLEEHKVKLIEVDEYNLAVFSSCAYKNYLIQVPLCWQDVLPDQVIVPCDWAHSVSYGIFYKENCSAAVIEFLNFVREIYSGRKDVGMVPVF